MFDVSDIYSGCQKTVPLSKRFFYNHIYRNSIFRNIFSDTLAYLMFIDLLIEISEMGNVNIAA